MKSIISHNDAHDATSLFDELNDVRVVVFMLLVIIRDLLL